MQTIKPFPMEKLAERSNNNGDSKNPTQEFTNEQLKKSQEIKKLCDKLTIDTSQFNNENEKWIELFNTYLGQYSRFSYAEISNCIFELTDEKSGIFDCNLHTVLETAYAQKNDEYKELWPKLLKFDDHINLAKKQHELLKNNSKHYETMLVERMEPQIAKITKEMSSQLIGLVSIFTALSFIIFGGITSLESIISNSNVIYTIISGLVWAFCMMNLLFIFMYFVLRITKFDSYLKYQEKKKNLVQEHPVIIFTNFVLGSGLALSLWVMYVDKHGIGYKIYESIIENESKNTSVFWITLILVMATIVITGTTLYKLYKKESINRCV